MQSSKQVILIIYLCLSTTVLNSKTILNVTYLSTFRNFHGWLCWGLTSQSTIFQSCRDGAIASWEFNQYFWGVKCLAQGHNTAAVGLEPRTSRSWVRHSTTETPLMEETRFLASFLYNLAHGDYHLKFSWGRLFLKLKEDLITKHFVTRNNCMCILY